MLTVQWPSQSATRAEIWRVLDLSGLSSSVRKSYAYLRSGFVYVNGQQILSLKETVPLAVPFTLEVRLPYGRILSEEIKLVPRLYVHRARPNGPTTRNYRG